MFFWDNSNCREWILVGTVAIWCSGCSLTKPLQRDFIGDQRAVYHTNGELELPVYGDVEHLVEERQKFIVYAHLLNVYEELIQPAVDTN